MSDLQLLNEANAVLEEADLLFDKVILNSAMDRMAAEITQRFGQSNPIILCVMNGGLIPAGVLLPRLHFPMQIDYLHATRYRGKTKGGELHWIKRPEHDLTGRTVLIVDDILDEGYTLKAIIAACHEMGARETASCVVVEKVHERNCGISADFVGLQVPDRYVFGYGMDYKTYWRNLDGIYAVKEPLIESEVPAVQGRAANIDGASR